MGNFLEDEKANAIRSSGTESHLSERGVKVERVGLGWVGLDCWLRVREKVFEQLV
jgi:hypothetical protein